MISSAVFLCLIAEVTFNLLQGNAGKCHFFVGTAEEVSLKFKQFITKNSKCEKRLRAKFDQK